MRYFTIKNFKRFQHYQSDEGAPRWIKLYRELLTDYDFLLLADDAKAHLMLIWLLASQARKPLPCDPKWIATRIGATGKVDLEPLISAGFLVIEPVTEGGLERISSDAIEPNGKSPSNIVSSDLVCSSSPEFEDFWKAYPRREHRQEADREWAKLDAVQRQAVLDDLPKRLASNWAGREVKHIPHAATYLHQRQWGDDVIPATARASPNGTLGLVGSDLAKARLAETIAKREAGT